MRNLEISEIKKLAGRKGARKIAVENFLGTMGTDEECAVVNLEMDRGLYGWDSKTVGAIMDGISKATREA